MEDKFKTKIESANTHSDLDDIYLEIYTDFIASKISSDDLSFYFGLLSSKYLKIKTEPFTNDFFEATSNGSEIDWYIRQPNNEAFVIRALEKIHRYAQKIANQKGVKLPHGPNKN